MSQPTSSPLGVIKAMLYGAAIMVLLGSLIPTFISQSFTHSSLHFAAMTAVDVTGKHLLNALHGNFEDTLGWALPLFGACLGVFFRMVNES